VMNVENEELEENLNMTYDIHRSTIDDWDPIKRELRDRINQIREVRSQLHQDTWNNRLKEKILNIGEKNHWRTPELIHKPNEISLVMGMKVEIETIPLIGKA
jgi:hypothetical protein